MRSGKTRADQVASSGTTGTVAAVLASVQMSDPEDVLLDTHAVMALARCSYKHARELLLGSGEWFRDGDRPVVTLGTWRRVVDRMRQDSAGPTSSLRTSRAPVVTLAKRKVKTRRRSGALQAFPGAKTA